MLLAGAELPAELVRAHKNGCLALFVGAGVSKPAPSSLPLLDGLADRVAERLDFSAEGTAEDRLQELDDRNLNVRAAARQIVSESVSPNAAHWAVAALAMAGPSPRVVTTNYDRHLSACLPEAAVSFEPPVLPSGADFSGVVYLHGSIAQDAAQLVLTRGDFARSYMAEGSPTLRFLHQLFVSQVVLFLGYSLNDTLMRYIVEAVNDNANLYTLTDKPDSADWQKLGIKPVGYRSHDDLPGVLNGWADRASASFEDHGRWVARIVSGPIAHDDLSPQDESYLTEVVADPDLVRIFTEHARGSVWFRWVAKGPGAKLFTPSEDLNATETALVQWFMWHHNDDEETATEMVRLIVENGGRLHETLWLNMAMAPDPRGGASRETVNRLLLVLCEAVPPDYPEFVPVVLRLIRQCETPQDDDLFVELVNRAWRPAVRPLNPALRPLEQLGPFEAACADPDGDPKRRRHDRDVWTERRHLAADLLSIVDNHLRRVHRIEAIAGNPDPFEIRPAVESHPQNQGATSVDFLVDAARDLWEILADDLSEVAIGFLYSWASSQWTVLNRLAIHAWTQRGDVSAEAKIAWLLEQDGWVGDHKLHHETMRLIAVTAPDASEDSIRALIDQIQSHRQPGDEQLVFNRLGWIAQHAPASTSARVAFDDARAENPDFEMLEHPDLLGWTELSFGPRPVEHIDGMFPHDLIERLEADPAAATAALLALAPADVPLQPLPDEWLQVLRAVDQATDLSPPAGLSLLETLIANAGDRPEARCSLASRVLTQLTASQSRQQTLEEHRDRIRRTMLALWDAGTTHWRTPLGPPSEMGWLYEANNAWPGHVASLILGMIAARIRVEPDAPGALGDDDKHVLQKVVIGDSHDAGLVQIKCAHRLAYLHAVDPGWTRDHIVPLLDPTADEQRAVRCWDAYLYDPRMSPELLDDGLQRHFVTFAQYANKCCEKSQQQYARLAARLCLAPDANDPSSPPPWLTSFSSRAPDSTRVAFISATAHLLREADSGTRQAEWGRWMHTYWAARLIGLPTNLIPDEESALVDWAVLLDDDFPTAVDLVLQSSAYLRKTSMLPLLMFDASRGEGPLIGLLDRHPDALARLIAHVLSNTPQDAAQRWYISMTRPMRELQARASTEAFERVRQQLVRLGWTYVGM